MRTLFVVCASWLGASICATVAISFVATRLRGERAVEMQPARYEEEFAG